MNSASDQHSSLWLDRVQDALEGELNAQERAELRAHLESCESCRTESAKLTALDARLDSALRVPRLDAEFATRVLARIDGAEASRRTLEKARAQAEFQRRLHALNPGWREFLSRHTGNLLAAVAALIALFAALSTWFETIEEAFAAALGSLSPSLGILAMPALFMTGSIVVASAAMLWLRRSAN